MGPVVYWVNAPVKVPAARNLKIIGGEYVMNFNGDYGRYLTFDSQENGDFHFSLVVCPALRSGTVVEFEPNAPTSSGYVGMRNCHVDINATVGSGDVFGNGTFPPGTSVRFDAAGGPIEHNEIFVREPIACQTGILLERGDICDNRITGRFTHICNNMLVVNSGTQNTIEVRMSPNNVGGTVVGANLAGGEKNTYRLTWMDYFAPGLALILGASARDNMIYTQGLAWDGITNNATVPTNRIIPVEAVGQTLGTPVFPASGASLVNRTGMRQVVTISDPGTVSQWTLTDSAGLNQTVSAGLYPGQALYLEPGDAVRFSYTAAPSWYWRVWR